MLINDSINIRVSHHKPEADKRWTLAENVQRSAYGGNSNFSRYTCLLNPVYLDHVYTDNIIGVLG
jgi:hypothetical protein